MNAHHQKRIGIAKRRIMPEMYRGHSVLCWSSFDVYLRRHSRENFSGADNLRQVIEVLVSRV
jgi:hypothetical protein